MAFTKKDWKEDGTTPITAAELNRIETGINDLVLVTGSNVNGIYTKFSDGTLICWYDASRTNIVCNDPYGPLFQGTFSWTFPFAFVDEPVVTIGLCKWGTGSSWGSVNGVTATAAELRIIDVASRATGTATDINAMAIGRWK